MRESGSQVVVDTIENALRWGGFKLFDERFQFDSSVNWVFSESLEGELDALIPAWDRNGHVVFVQPGIVFWSGIEDEKRIDGNLGAVYRTEVFDGIVGGVNLFYDNDFKMGHSRISVGVDVQKDDFYGAFNYYAPLTDTQDGREGYVEDALEGMDAILGIESEVARFSGNVGYWNYQGEEDVEDEMEFSYGIDGGIRIFPGFFLEGSLQHHDDASIGRRASVGVAVRFSLPDLTGKSYGNSGRVSNLYKFVERERRILYEEREATPLVRLGSPADENGQALTPTSTIEEGSTVTIAGELEALSVPVVLELVIDEMASSADLGDDFNYGHEVYVPDETTGQPSAPGTVTDCPEARCQMMIPAGVTRFDVEIEILTDTAEKEVPEEVVLQIDVPEAYRSIIRSRETTTVAIRAHGNTIGFASATSTLSENGRTPEGMVAVSVGIDLPSPTPITLNVETGGTATEGANGDYTISTSSTRSLTIPANASSASLTLTGIDNNVGGGNKTIELTLSGSLPEGWALGTQTTHTVTLLDDDLAIGFAIPGASDAFNPARIFEEDTTMGLQHGVTVRVESTQPAPTEGFDLAWEVRSMEGDDQVDSTSGAVDFSSGDSHKEFTLMITRESTPEGETPVTVRLSTPTSLPTGWNFGVQEYTFTIETSDAVIEFASTDPVTADEGDTLTFEVTSTVAAPSTGIPITVGFNEGSDAMGAGADLNFETALMFPAGQSSHSFTVEVIDDSAAESAEEYNIFIAPGPGFPNSWGVVVSGTHTITINPSDPPTASLNYSGNGMIPGRSTTRMRIDLSESLGENVTVTLKSSGTATYATAGNGTWNLAYIVLPSGTTPAQTFNFANADATCGSVGSGGCQITIQSMQTIVDIAVTSEGLTSGETIMLTLEISSAGSIGLTTGTSSTVDLTVQ